jgi:7,8-dihydropterin-6-yl-methyl-4-(beta-D-ribofuranosyl)aminobenzene 5'-phosphate synthase
MGSVEPFRAPVVDSLSVRVVVDSVFDQFMPKAAHPMVAIEHVGRIRNNLNSTLAGEWGLSLHLESRTASETGQYLLDFGYTPEILLRNFSLLGIEPERLNGLILSHGHRDHYGGLSGFVAHYRDRMRDDLRLFAGGNEHFVRSGSARVSKSQLPGVLSTAPHWNLPASKPCAAMLRTRSRAHSPPAI